MKRIICFFTGDMSRGGGTERMASVIANNLAKNNKYKVIIISLKNDENKSFFELKNSIKHIIINDKDDCDKRNLLKSILKLRQVIKKNKVDIVINVDVMLGIFSIPAILFTKVKLISWEHFNYMDNIGSKKTKYIRKISMFFSKKYIVLTKKDEEKFKSDKVLFSSIKHIYNTCVYDKDYYDYNKDSKIIMSAGNFYKTKGFDFTVDIGKIVFSRYPEWKWYIYGDGEELDNINKMIIDSNLQKNIIIKPRTKEIIKAFRESAMFVLTSRMESFALVLLEAQSNNVPTISFNIPSGPSEIIENNVNGFLVDMFDINDMADKICLLIEDKELRKRFSINSRKNINKFGEKNIISKWEEVIDSI